jgi:hypothetical protein
MRFFWSSGRGHGAPSVGNQIIARAVAAEESINQSAVKNHQLFMARFVKGLPIQFRVKVCAVSVNLAEDFRGAPSGRVDHESAKLRMFRLGFAL